MGSRHLAVAALAVALLAGPDYTAGAETITVPPCGSTPGTTAGAYSGLVTVMVSGSLVITPGNPDQDAFYNFNESSPATPVSPNQDTFRYNRVSEGTCLCGFECPSTSHRVSDILVGAYPSYNSSHTYTVQIDLGNAPATALHFGIYDCGCGDNSGQLTVTIRATGTPGYCSFSGAACTTDVACGIPGVCYVGADGPVCHHKCATNADCTASTFCFQNGEIGGICVGCGQAGYEDNSKCTAYESCQRNDCKQFGHTECAATGLPCTITDPCIGGSATTTSTTTTVTTTSPPRSTVTTTTATTVTTSTVPHLTRRQLKRRCRQTCRAAVADCVVTSRLHRRACRRLVIGGCRINGLQFCVIPPPTIPPTTTTLPPVRERTVSGIIIMPGGTARLTVDVRDGPQVVLAAQIISGSLFICHQDFHIIQGGRQIAISPFNDVVGSPDACFAQPIVCDTYYAGVSTSMTATDCPTYFDVNASFAVNWSGVNLEVP